LVDVVDVPVFNAIGLIRSKPGRKPFPQKGKMLWFFESDAAQKSKCRRFSN
jgi:hypothetical protein